MLPETGTSVGIIIALAAVSVLGGGLLVRMTRRRGTLAAVLLIAMVVLAAAPARAASDCPTTTAPSIPATSAAAPSSLAPTTVPEPVSSTTIAPETTTTSMATTTSSTSTTTTVPLTPVLSVSFAPTFDPDYCLVIVNATGFPADSTVSGELRHTSDIDSAGPWPFSIPTDGSGSGSADLISYYQSDWNNQFNAVAGSLESGFTPISC